MSGAYKWELGGKRGDCWHWVAGVVCRWDCARRCGGSGSGRGQRGDVAIREIAVVTVLFRQQGGMQGGKGVHSLHRVADVQPLLWVQDATNARVLPGY